MDIITENYYGLFELYHKSMVKEVDEIVYTDELELILRLKNGDYVAFYVPDGSLRNLPSDDVTEIECRKEFAIRLGRMMWKRGMTQVMLAETSGVPQRSISKYLNGKMTPSFYNVERMARALKCSIDDLRFVVK